MLISSMKEKEKPEFNSITNKMRNKKISRRAALSTAAKTAIGVVVAGVIAGVSGFYIGSSAAKTETLTKTETVTAAKATVTETITKTVTQPVTKEVTKTVTVTASVPATTTQTTVTTAPSTAGVINMYVAQGWYPGENEAMQALVNKFTKETGIGVNLTFLAEADLHKKIIAGCTAGNPPDIAHYRMADHVGQELAWKGWLEDVSEFEDKCKELDYFDWAIDAAYIYDAVRKQKIMAFVPFSVDSTHFTYWRDLLEEAGMPSAPEEIPLEWDEFVDFWKEAQDKLWSKKPEYKEKVYGIGWPSLGGIGVDPGDGWGQIAHMLAWFGFQPLKDGKVVMDSPENIEAMKKVVKWIVDVYNAGYMPKGIIDWGSPDNNKAFHAKQIVSVFNCSLSIPLYWWTQDKDAYFNKTATLSSMPTFNGKKGANLWYSFGWWVFKDGKNKDLAKRFIEWFLKPENINYYLKAKWGREFPASRTVLEYDPFWKNGNSEAGRNDPHIPTFYYRLMEQPGQPVFHQMIPYPSDVTKYGYPLAAAVRVITEGVSVDEAVEDAINDWVNFLKKYQEEIEKW